MSGKSKSVAHEGRIRRRDYRFILLGWKWKGEACNEGFLANPSAVGTGLKPSPDRSGAPGALFTQQPELPASDKVYQETDATAGRLMMQVPAKRAHEHT